MDSKPGNQGKSVRRRKSGKGRKDMEGSNIPNKSKNPKETECKIEISSHTFQKESNIQENKLDKAESSKTSREDKVSAVLNKKYLDNKTPDKINKCDDKKETRSKQTTNLTDGFKNVIEKRHDKKTTSLGDGFKDTIEKRHDKKTTNLGDGFKDAIEKRHDEAEASIHSLSKNMKYARRKKKTNEKIEDSWNKSFMQNTASFMVKGEIKDDQVSPVKEHNIENINTSNGKSNLVSNKTENIKVDEIKNETEMTFCLLGSEKLSPEPVQIEDDNSQQSKSMEEMNIMVENVNEEYEENKDTNSSGTEISLDMKETNSQIKFPPYRSRFVSDSEGIKKFIKDQPKSENSSKPNTDVSHQKQESIITSSEMTKENNEPPDDHLCDITDEEEKSVKFFISDDESDSDTAIFVDVAHTESQDQDMSDTDAAILVDTDHSESQNLYTSSADIKLIGSDDTTSEKEPISDRILKTNESPNKEDQNIFENKDIINNDSCLSIKNEINKTDSSVYIDMIENDSDIIRDIILENAAMDKKNISKNNSFDCGASAIDKIFDEITSNHKDEEDDKVESHMKEEKGENLMCFPWAGEETKEYKLDEILKSTSNENQEKTCESESDPERVDFAEPKSSEEKDKSSKTEQSSRSISGFGRSYRNSQRFEGLTNSITQEEFLQKEITGNETSLAMGKSQNTPGQDNMVCGAVSKDISDLKNITQVVDDMSFLGITNKVNAPNINISLEEMEGELEMKTEQYIKQKHSELSSDAQANVKSKNPFHPDNLNNKNVSEPLPFATAFETLASIKKSLLEAQEYPFQNKLNELSGYTKIQSDEDIDNSKDSKSENTQKTAFSTSSKSTPGIGDKIKEMLGLGHNNEDNDSPNIKTMKQDPALITHIDKSNNSNFSDPSQNNPNLVNLRNTDCVDSNSKSNTNIENPDNVSQPTNSLLKEPDGAIGKAETLIKSGKSVLNICDPRKIAFSSINKKYKVDVSLSENQPNRLVNQKEGKCIKPLKKYSTRSLSQPVPVKTDGYEIISESNLLSKTKINNECQYNRVKTEKPYLRRTMSQDKYEETSKQPIYPAKQQPTKTSEKVLNDIKKLKESITDPIADKQEMGNNLTDDDSKLIDVESSENNSLMTWSTDSPIIDHCKSSEMEAYTKYFKKFTHTSEKFIHSLTDTTYESLEGENLRMPESGTINTGLWDQRKFDELNIPENSGNNQDRTNKDYSSIMIFDDLCPDKWKEQCKEDTNMDKKNESSLKIENDSGIKREPAPICQATALENFDVKADHSNIEKHSQSSIRKPKVSWLLNNDSNKKNSQSVQSPKQSAMEGAHTKSRRLYSPPPKLPTAIEITDADFDAAIMSPTSPDFNASGSLNTLLSKLSNADICMDKKYRPLSKFSDQLHSVQQSKPPSFTSTLKVSERNYSSKEKDSETSKRPELVSTTIADWKVSSPVFSAELTLTPPANKNPNSIVGLKEPVHLVKSDMKTTTTEQPTRTTEKLSSSMLTFTEKLSSITKTSISSATSFTDKFSAPSPENHLSTPLYSVREKRPSVTPIQSPTGFKGSPDIPTHSTDNFSFSDILEDCKFKIDGVRSTKI